MKIARPIPAYVWFLILGMSCSLVAFFLLLMLTSSAVCADPANSCPPFPVPSIRS